MTTITVQEDELIRRFSNVYVEGFKCALETISIQANREVDGKPFMQNKESRNDLDFLISMIQTMTPMISEGAYKAMKEKLNE